MVKAMAMTTRASPSSLAAAEEKNPIIAEVLFVSLSLLLFWSREW